jgi:DNA-binding MarR family transcriptional regulator
VDDALRALGYLALGSRLKRVGEHLQQQTQEILESFGISLTAAHFPVLAALDRAGPMSIGALTQALGIAQPGVTRFVNTLAAQGLVDVELDGEDRRMRVIALSAEGRRLVGRAKKLVWPAVERAVVDASSFAPGSLLDQITKLEAALNEKRLIARTGRRRSAADASA